jgi:hypothetical protein
MKEVCMASRITNTTVTFRRPFILDGFESIREPGVYAVDTNEEQIEALSISAWHRTSTVMRLQHGGTVESVSIDPDQLREALMRDGAQTESSPTEAKARHNRARGIQFRR